MGGINVVRIWRSLKLNKAQLHGFGGRELIILTFLRIRFNTTRYCDRLRREGYHSRTFIILKERLDQQTNWGISILCVWSMEATCVSGWLIAPYIHILCAESMSLWVIQVFQSDIFFISLLLLYSIKYHQLDKFIVTTLFLILYFISNAYLIINQIFR